MRHDPGRLLALCLPLLFGAAAQAAEPLTALRIEKGSVARSQVVAVGRDLRVEGEAAADVVSINGTSHITGRVAGDVIVLGGDALLSSTARGEGDVFVHREERSLRSESRRSKVGRLLFGVVLQGDDLDLALGLVGE